MEGLHQRGVEEKLIAALQTDLDKADLTDQDKALVRLAEVLTTSPQSSRSAVRSAKDFGWSAEEIADVIFIASYFNMRTRLMNAFDPPPNKWHPFTPGASLPILRCPVDK